MLIYFISSLLTRVWGRRCERSLDDQKQKSTFRTRFAHPASGWGPLWLSGTSPRCSTTTRSSTLHLCPANSSLTSVSYARMHLDLIRFSQIKFFPFSIIWNFLQKIKLQWYVCVLLYSIYDQILLYFQFFSRENVAFSIFKNSLSLKLYFAHMNTEV